MSTRSLLALATLSLVQACGGSAFPEPAEPDLQSAAQRWPGTQLAELQEGRTMYLRRCGNCHRPFEPGEVAAGDWPKVIAGMQAQAKLSDAQAINRLRSI